MARDLDVVKAESTLTRRKRLRQAFLLGDVSARREVDDGTKPLIMSIILAGVACAGCVGFSFVSQLLASNETPVNTVTVSTPLAQTPTPPSSSTSTANFEPTPHATGEDDG